MQYDLPVEAIEFAYQGRVYTVWALPGPAPRQWRYGCQELGIVNGDYATAKDALLGGISAIIQFRTDIEELAA